MTSPTVEHKEGKLMASLYVVVLILKVIQSCASHYLFPYRCHLGKDNENKRGKDNAPYGEYGGWHKAAKVDR